MTGSAAERAQRRVGVVVPGGFPGLPTYRVPAAMPALVPGARVAVPFGTRVLAGVVAEVEPAPPPAGTVEREVAARIDAEPFLPPALLEVLLRAAAYYFAPPGELLRAAVPGRLLSLAGVRYAIAPGPVAPPADEAERKLREHLAGHGAATSTEIEAVVGARRAGKALRSALLSGAVRVVPEAVRSGAAPVRRAFRALLPPPGAERLLARSPRQRALHELLVRTGRWASVEDLRPAGATLRRLEALVHAGLAEEARTTARADLSLHAGAAFDSGPPVPTEAQAEAIAAVGEAVGEGRARELLLDGVTGSGKTEVYLAAIEAARARGRSAILLVPEIALAPALIRRLLGRLGDDRVALLHSSLSDGERAAEWERARRGEADVVVGPRSAVFAPLPRLGLVVVDEAHEAGYKQAEAPRYDARDVARSRAKAEGIVLLLGSATPSMELERRAREGRLRRLVLPARPGARSRAAVEVVDVRKEPPREGDHGRVLFASRTLEILRDCFDRGEQAILLLNRRGFSPSLLCRACGNDFRCGSCSVARTYHRLGERLLCHYCGDAVRRPAVCPGCGGTALMPVGFGTERLAERFAEAFPGVPFALLDRDAASRRGGAARVLLDFESGAARALLGTQMVAKGHDFPNATALAVLDADALLSFPDFRAAERTFQLVTQAAGRVGRGDRPGLVAVQTARPDHEAILAAVRQDHQAFAQAELGFRRAFRYPPFAHLLLALWTDEDREAAESAAREATAALLASPPARDVRVLGPAPAPLERLKGLWRFHSLVKSESREAIARAGALLSGRKPPPRLDVDPQSLL